MLCVKDCSGKAISATETVKVKVAGRELEWGKLDELKCSYAFLGGLKEINPFLPKDTDENKWNEKWGGGKEFAEVCKYATRDPYGHTLAIEGARGCIRACMIHLEEQGKLKNKFKESFRKRKPWKL